MPAAADDDRSDDGDVDGPAPARSEGTGDRYDSGTDIAIAHAHRLIHHQLHPEQPLPSAGDMVEDDMRGVLAHGLMQIGRDPVVVDWLDRPRSVPACVIAFLLGGVLVSALYFWFGLPGVFGAAFLVGPIFGVGVSLVLARLIVRLRYRARLPKPRIDGLTVAFAFVAGLVVTVSIIATATGSWITHYLLVMPILIVILVVCITPMYYVGVKDSYEAD